MIFTNENQQMQTSKLGNRCVTSLSLNLLPSTFSFCFGLWIRLFYPPLYLQLINHGNKGILTKFDNYRYCEFLHGKKTLDMGSVHMQIPSSSVFSRILQDFLKMFSNKEIFHIILENHQNEKSFFV